MICPDKYTFCTTYFVVSMHRRYEFMIFNSYKCQIKNWSDNYNVVHLHA
jgi:hypothetical protein